MRGRAAHARSTQVHARFTSSVGSFFAGRCTVAAAESLSAKSARTVSAERPSPVLTARTGATVGTKPITSGDVSTRDAHPCDEHTRRAAPETGGKHTELGGWRNGYISVRCESQCRKVLRHRLGLVPVSRDERIRHHHASVPHRARMSAAAALCSDGAAHLNLRFCDAAPARGLRVELRTAETR
jgi:hypothetical protein